MIRSATNMVKALKGNKPKFAGVILYEGPSLIDGAPIVAIANRIAGRKSKNGKTGSQVQTFIIRSDVAPLVALKQGLDSSVCGNCFARPANGGFCYVQVGKSVQSVFHAYKRNRYARPNVDYDPAILPELFRDRDFRIGAYGDGAAIPLAIWEDVTRFVASHTAYSHQWRTRPELKTLFMASCDTAKDYLEAKAMGFRTFRIRLQHELAQKREAMCPASKEAGQKTVCQLCKACGGNSAKAKADMVIIAHGPTARRYEAWRNQIAA